MARTFNLNLQRHQFSWAICDCCRGEGKVENSAFSNGFTSDQWEQMDYDDRSTYLSGAYDQVCHECKGEGKVKTPKFSALTFSQKRILVEQRRYETYRNYVDAESAAERRMGA